jgi:hypothetical protein
MKTQDVLDQIAYLQELINQTRLRAADGYPYFILWGLLWIVGYTGSILWSHLVWAGILVAGGLISAVIGFKKKKTSRAPVTEKDRLADAGFTCLYFVFVQPVAARHG